MLGGIPYLILNARYEKVRMKGSVVSCAVFLATGVPADGKRSVLGVDVAICEAELHWRGFLLNLKKEGLYGVKLVASDERSPAERLARRSLAAGSGASSAQRGSLCTEG